MVKIICTSFIIISKVFVIYLVFISSFSIFGRKNEKETKQKLKFAVLIPARNEEDSIAGLIHSLKNQDYASDLIDIFVVVNNCTDNTAGVAESNGAYIIDCPESVKYKGGALQFSINKLLKAQASYDAFLVFDADNEVSPSFVLSMNRTLANGARVAKGRILAKNPEDSWLATCYEIHFCTANLFLNRARANIGLSARLIGTGFAIRSDFLHEIGGFNTTTITEDAEFFAICAGYGERIAFCEDAITYDEQSNTFKSSLIQRKRWMSGIMRVFILKFKDLSRGLLRKKSAKYSFDALVQFAFSYLQALFPFILFLNLVNEPQAFLHNLLFLVFKGYLYVLATAFIVLLVEKRLSYSKNSLAGILLYPIFVFSFIPIQTLSLFKKTLNWQEIKHGQSTSDKDLNAHLIQAAQRVGLLKREGEE